MSESSLTEKLSSGFGCLFAIGVMIYSIVVLGVGWIGIEEELGWGWAFFATILAFGFRFILPLTVGAVFGAMNLWGWHWSVAALFAMPTLIFMVPFIVAALFESFKKK